MKFTDAHCHLYDVENLEDEIKICKEFGFLGILCVSENLKTMEKALKMRDLYGDFIYPALGIHPVFITLNSEENIKNSFNFLRKHIKEAYAIGEIGLDFKYAKDEKEKEKQYFWLKEQMDLAREEKKPINLHSRRALKEVAEIGINYFKETNLPVLLHWFTHSRKLIKKAVEENLFISVGPSILFDENTIKVAKTIPFKNLLLESDAPVPFNNISSKPSLVCEIAKKISKVNNTDLEELSSIIFENFKRYILV